jgi:uncharacterized RDD family membrane protein YckC
MYCSHCGIQIADGAHYCPSCGQPAGVAPVIAPASPQIFPGPVQPPNSHITTRAPYVLTGSVGYAGFWLRFVAIIIDGIIIDVVFGVPFFMLLGGAGFFRDMVSGNAPSDVLTGVSQTILLYDLIFGVGSWLYFSLMESSSWQGTLGKKALGIYVTDMEGRRLSFGRATGRYFAKILSLLTLMIGYIMAGTTERKQALHDMVAGTLVLRKR